MLMSPFPSVLATVYDGPMLVCMTLPFILPIQGAHGPTKCDLRHDELLLRSPRGTASSCHI